MTKWKAAYQGRVASFRETVGEVAVTLAVAYIDKRTAGKYWRHAYECAWRDH